MTKGDRFIFRYIIKPILMLLLIWFIVGSLFAVVYLGLEFLNIISIVQLMHWLESIEKYRYS